MEFYEYDTRIAAYAVVIEGDRILLSWYRGNDRSLACWSLPGGGVNYDESVVEAIVRETHEETGLMLEVDRFLAADSFTEPEGPRPPRPYKSLRLIYSGRVIGGTLGTLEIGGSTERAEWVDLATLPELPHADIIRIGLAAMGIIKA